MACTDDSRESTTNPARKSAEGGPTADAYGALVRGDYAALPRVIDALDESVANDSEDQSAVFYAGVMRLWRITQRADDPSYDSSDFASDTQTAFDDLDRARKLDPGDPHAAGFYGIARVNAGKLLGDQKTMDEGGQVLEDAVPLYPAYIHGIQALAFGTLPKDHADFPKAVDALTRTVEACTATAPAPGTPLLAYSADVPLDRVGTCSDEGVVAHVWEGFWLTYGDVTTKQGKIDEARLAYGNAKGAPRYDRWTLADVLERRLDDLDERARLYADADPANDPTTWMDEGHLCVGCHADAP